MIKSLNNGDLPLGERVENTAPASPPERRSYEGRFVNLSPVDPPKDAAELYRNSHGSAKKIRLWTYMAYGPFADETEMQQWLEVCKASIDPWFLTVASRELNRRVGMVSFLNIVPQMRSLELGNIWYAPVVHHTNVNTEAVYLMLSEAFDGLSYRRVEWKCDALNAKSRTAALRLGFSFEGIFRQHYIIKGRNRDTAWFAMLDRDWPAVKSNMNRWLYSDEKKISLAELNRPLLRSTAFT
jgi:RimJ/RimL family protein N-acetyltransferase